MSTRTIIVKEGEKVVYEGPEQRHAQHAPPPPALRIFGLSADTWVKIAGFIFAGLVFYIRTDDFMKTQADINRQLTTFARNSDNYHSATTGRQFEGGKPIGFITRAYAAEENRGVVSRTPRDDHDPE